MLWVGYFFITIMLMLFFCIVEESYHYYIASAVPGINLCLFLAMIVIIIWAGFEMRSDLNKSKVLTLKQQRAKKLKRINRWKWV